MENPFSQHQPFSGFSQKTKWQLHVLVRKYRQPTMEQPGNPHLNDSESSEDEQMVEDPANDLLADLNQADDSTNEGTLLLATMAMYPKFC